MTLKDLFIIDANFFISIFKLKREEVIKNLMKGITELKLDNLYTSNLVLNELKLPRTSVAMIKKFLKFVPVSRQKINELSQNVNPSATPQMADLSLVALAKILKQKFGKKAITVVTNDFKLSKFIHSYSPQFNVLPPSSFLMMLVNSLDNRLLRNYFKKIRKKLINYEMSYALERKDIYNPQEKLSWLVEKAIGVACQCNLILQKDDLEIEQLDSKRELFLINRYILGEKLSKSQFNAIKNLIPFLDSIKKSQKKFNKIKRLLIDNRLSDSLVNVQEIISDLMNTFQLSMVSLMDNEKDTFKKVISKFLAQFEFFISMLYLELDELEQALEHFDKTIVFSFLAEQSKNIIIANYIKGLSLIFNNRFKDAADQFSLSHKLAGKFKSEQYRIINMGGEAIARFLAGENEKAQEIMKNVNTLVEKNLEMSLLLMTEFADNFYVMSRPEIAIHLYNEALEISIELGKLEQSERIIEKLKRCFYSIGSCLPPMAAQLQKVIDLAHQQSSSESIEKYNLEISKISEINKLLFEDFPIKTGKKWIKGINLPEFLKGPMDLISANIKGNISMETGTSTITSLICLTSEHGGIAINVPEPLMIGTPELYKVRLNKKGTYKIIEASQIEKEKFFIRAKIYVKSKDDLILKKIFPKLYGKFFEN
ncbi:MAG: hypothetical protein HWN67_22605 [Candidatus Helarchaeota archaeon]|nr:hypothetical protein [Candidatus Helarchaeota archaeon]